MTPCPFEALNWKWVNLGVCGLWFFFWGGGGGGFACWYCLKSVDIRFISLLLLLHT